jgi:hypothetical protein
MCSQCDENEWKLGGPTDSSKAIYHSFFEGGHKNEECKRNLSVVILRKYKGVYVF